MGLFSSIKKAVFGSDGKSETETRSTLSPEQQEIEKLLSQILPGLQANPDQFTGDVSPGATNLENLSLAALEEQALQLGTEGNALNEEASRAISELLTRSPTDFEDFFQTNVRQPALEDFEEDQLSGIGRRFADQFFGSDRVKKDIEAEENLIDSLIRSRSDLAFRSAESDADRKLQAAIAAPGIAGADLEQLISLFQVGATERGLNAEDARADLEKFLANQGVKQGSVDDLLAFLSRGNVENITTVTQPTSGLVGGFAEGFGKTVGNTAFTKALSKLGIG